MAKSPLAQGVCGNARPLCGAAVELTNSGVDVEVEEEVWDNADDLWATARVKFPARQQLVPEGNIPC